MKLLSLEKYLLKNNLDDEEFKKLISEISEKLELEVVSEDRKLRHPSRKKKLEDFKVD